MSDYLRKELEQFQCKHQGEKPLSFCKACGAFVSVTLELVEYEPDCPKCLDGHLEKHSHTFIVGYLPNVPDCDWLECDSCDFKTEPE